MKMHVLTVVLAFTAALVGAVEPVDLMNGVPGMDTTGEEFQEPPVVSHTPPPATQRKNVINAPPRKTAMEEAGVQPGDVVTLDLFQKVKGQQLGLSNDELIDRQLELRNWGLWGKVYQQLADKQITSAFKRALDLAVRPTSIVVDVLSGNGLLAMLAVKAGAQHAYVYESDEKSARLVQALVDSNSLSSKVTILTGDINSHAQLPNNHKADLVVTCNLNSLRGIRTDVMSKIYYVVKQWSNPDVAMIPAKAKVWIMPIQSAELRKGFRVLDSVEGFDYGSLNKRARLKSPKAMNLNQVGYQNLAEPLNAFTFQLISEPEEHQKEASFYTSELKLISDGTLDGFVGWFDLQLLDDNEDLVISSAPRRGTKYLEQFMTQVAPVKMKLGQTADILLGLLPSVIQMEMVKIDGEPFWAAYDDTTEKIFDATNMGKNV